MKISLVTDAPRHNLALMKISAYHKQQGHAIKLNDPRDEDEMTYGSWLFKESYPTDICGGTGVDPSITLPKEIEQMKPDYSLYPSLDFSLGYTWHHCPRKCPFCCVPKQHIAKVHHSIYGFIDRGFRKICLLNNNTFSDPQWKDTFEEIWDADLIVKDENGYDLRLLDEEKADALKRIKFEGRIHFSWDLVENEAQILRGLKLVRQFKLKAMIYVLIGYNTDRQQDLYRCQIINDLKLDSYPMPYNGGTKEDRAFKRFICLRAYRQYPTLELAWIDYLQGLAIGKGDNE